VNVLLDRPDLVSDDPKVAILSALWFWNTNKLHLLNDVEKISRRVNGGTHGMEDRVMRYKRALSVLS
jgi:putative chitinase